jgi:hypothetical protein
MLNAARSIVAQHLGRVQAKSKEVYDASARPTSYELEGVVLLKAIIPPKVPVRKLYPRYVGPYRVKRIKQHVLGVVPLLAPQGKIRYIHSDRAIPCPHDAVLDQSMDQLLSPFTSAASVDPNLEAEAPE